MSNSLAPKARKTATETGRPFKWAFVFPEEKIVRATTNYRDAGVLAEVSVGLGEAMPGIDAARMADEAKIQHRGW